MQQSILLVEGSSDRVFFKHFIKNNPALAHVQIYAPKDLEGTGDGFEGVVGILQTQVQRLAAGGKLGIVVDADHESTGKGFHRRRKTIIDEIKEVENNGYTLPTAFSAEALQGELFEHQDGLPPIGLWVMPDHFQSEGMFENFLLETISPSTPRELLKETIETTLTNVQNNEDLTDIRFKEIHHHKKIFDTWLNWQKKPNRLKKLGTMTECALEDNWLDPNHQNFTALTNWLGRVFA